LKKTNPNSSSKGSSFSGEQYLYLTTRGRKSGRPREIEIWFTQRDGRFYLIAEYPTSKWMQNLRADPRVQVRLGGESFAAQARFIIPEAEPELHRAIAGLSAEKYGWGDGTIVELVRDSDYDRTVDCAPNSESGTDNGPLIPDAKR
jgi:deazaflavin-dependent oxidoreductase (nitroreductase family)